MKKIDYIEQLQEILRNIILTQDCEEINNFNTLYDYSNIKNMSDLWEDIKERLKNEKIDWKNIKFPTLDMKNVVNRELIFERCPLYEINLINTYNVKNFHGGFEDTKNLEKISIDLNACEDRDFIFQNSGVREVEILNTQKIKNLKYGFFQTENLEKLNSLYLDNCESMTNCFERTNIKELKLYNTRKIKEWYSCFRNTNIEEIELDMSLSENCGYMFFDSKIKKLELKNTQNIKNIRGFIQGCKYLDYLEMNVSNIKYMSDFIDDRNNLKYLKISGLEEYLKEKEGINNNSDYNEKLSISQKINSITHVEIVKKNTTFSIISDNKLNMRLEKRKEKEEMMNIKKEKIKSQKEYSLEINI